MLSTFSNMSEKNSFSLFDQLATEILLDIFDYLSCNDIIYTFFYLNQRFHSILLQHHQLLNHFTTPTNNFSFWQTILPIISSQIKSLTITTTDFSFSLDLFPNLKSLIISSPLSIYRDEFALILKNQQFKQLTSLKIKSEIVSKTGVYDAPLLHAIFENDNSLHIFESVAELYLSFTNVSKPKISVHLQSLSLKLVNLTFLFSLLDHTPNLKYLNLSLSSFFASSKQSNSNIDFSRIKLKKFSFALENDLINQQSFRFLTWFIKQFSSSLTYLSLKFNAEEFQFDGLTLQQQLLESMLQLKSFHFYTRLNKELVNIGSLLWTFQTQFWFDHQWTVGTHGAYLYTLPFYFEKLKDFTNFNQIQSTNSVVLNSPQTWSYVKSIDFSQFFEVNSNLIEEIKLRMPNVTSPNIDFQLMNNLYTDDNETNETDITFDGITTVNYQGGYPQAIKHWLLNIFPNASHFIVSDSSPSLASLFLEKLDEYFHNQRMAVDYIGSSKVEYVKIRLTSTDIHGIYQHVIRLANELLKLFDKLQSFIFVFYQAYGLSSPLPFTDLSEMIELLKMEKIFKEYQIKHKHNYLQFVRMNNE